MEQVLVAISVLSKIGNIGGKAMENGKIGVEDIALVPDLAMLYPVIVSVKWPEVLTQLKTLSVEQADQAVAHFKAEFNIPQDDVEVKIETVIELVEKVVVLVLQVIDTVKAVLAVFKKPA